MQGETRDLPSDGTRVSGTLYPSEEYERRDGKVTGILNTRQSPFGGTPQCWIDGVQVDPSTIVRTSNAALATEDDQGNLHKGKGPGGGQFTSKSDSDGGSASGKEPSATAKGRLIESKASMSIHSGDTKEIDRVVKKLIGPDFSPQVLSSLVGAPDNSEVTVRPDFMGASRNALLVGFDSPEVEASREISEDGSKKVIHNQIIEIRPEYQNKGLGTKIFSNQVHNSRVLGFDEISCFAMRDPTTVGYYTWPRLGYDAPISTHSMLSRSLISKIQSAFPKARTIQDIMSTREGREWWKKYGDSFTATFDLSDGSRSMQVLEEYLRVLEEVKRK